jgi:hypothetical protein
MAYELKHIHGIPYYLREGRVYTFELRDRLPSPDCVAIGTYDAATDSLAYDTDFMERLEPRLAAYRAALTIKTRDGTPHEKPQKLRLGRRATQRTRARATDPEGDGGGH